MTLDKDVKNNPEPILEKVVSNEDANAASRKDTANHGLFEHKWCPPKHENSKGAIIQVTN